MDPDGTVATKVQSAQTGEASVDVDAEGTADPLGYVGTGETVEYGSSLVSAEELLDELGVADLSVLGEGDAVGLAFAVDSPPSRAAAFLARIFLPG